jgi:MFS family permease
VNRLLTPFAALSDVFRNPDLGKLQLAWTATSFSMWAFAITLGVYAFDVGGAAAVGIAGLVRLLPGALASPFGGLMGDRYSRKLVLVLSSAGVALVVVASALAVSLDAPAAVVFALAGLSTVIWTPYIPAEGALVPRLSRTPQECSAANVTHSVMDSAGFLAGAVVSGVLLTATSISFVFAVAAAAAAAAALTLMTMSKDERPTYSGPDAAGMVGETTAGFRTLLGDPPLRLLGASVALLVFLEGAADVLIVIIALELLGLADSAVGYLNAAWGVGALVAGAVLAVLINRGKLVAGLVIGSLLTGAALALPGLWPVVVVVYVAWFGIGIGYTLVEVASNTLLQRLGDDESLARARGALETARLSAMALGSICVALLVELVGVQAAVIAFAALLPAFALLRWRRLRSFEMLAPVEESHFALLRSDRIFAPLSLATLERITHDLVAVDVKPGQEVIVQGEVGDRFYLIESGRVEVLEHGVHRRFQEAGESFGEIALLRDTPRTATVVAAEPTRLLALDSEHFILAVTGHARTQEQADDVIGSRLGPVPGAN